MKRWAVVAFPAALFPVVALVLGMWPEGHLSAGGVLPYLPHVIFGVAALLGAVFAQTRVLFLSLAFSFVLAAANYHAFVKSHAGRAQVLVFLSSLYLPVLAAAFHRFSERGLWNAYGRSRVFLVLSTCLVSATLPLVPELGEAMLGTASPLLRPFAPWVRIPLVGFLAFGASLPFMVIRARHESPALGLLAAVSVLYALGGLAVASPPCGIRGQVMLSWLMAGSGLTLIWTVLESSWRSANMDELTELPGRRALQRHLGRLEPPYAIAVLDVDHFKKINDRYGHDAGDQILRFLAAFLHRLDLGTAYRFGGEEFVIVYEGGDFGRITDSLERLRRAIRARLFWIRGKDRPAKKQEGQSPAPGRRRESLTVTVSIGAARNIRGALPPQELFEAADKAMYRAKQEGRDRVKVAG